jgi:hypothetical protein
VVQIVRVGGLRLDFDEHEPAMSKLKDNRDRGRPRGPTPPTPPIKTSPFLQAGFSGSFIELLHCQSRPQGHGTAARQTAHL